MEYCIYKFNFKTAVHIGSGKLSDGEMVMHADTLFSALCHEALLMDGEDMLAELLSYVNSGKLQFSDCFPFLQKNTYYIPKPMHAVPHDDAEPGTDRKAYKKLKYIPADRISDYLDGNLDVVSENSSFAKHAGMYSVKTSAKVSESEDTLPYGIGTWSFPQDSGLYFIMGYESDEIYYFVSDLMDSLSYSGIGGKRTAGLGRFVCGIDKVPESLLERLNAADGSCFMSLSVSLPEDDELEHVIGDAEYLMLKRSGFVASEKYAQTLQKKKDIYLFREGSCFTQRFDGQVADVSDGGSHPVYRYARAMWMKVD